MPCGIGIFERIVLNVGITVETLRVCPWCYIIWSEELAQSRVVVSGIVIQQARAIKSLPGVVKAGLADTPTLDLTPGVEILLAGNVTPTGGGKAHTPQVVAVQVGHGIGATVPHRYGAATKGVILFFNPGAVLFPLAQVEGGDAVPAAVNPVGVAS